MSYDIKLALMCGTDIPIPECQLTLHQPKIKEIALIGDMDFFTGIQTLCINKNMLMGETLLANANNFQIFMAIMQEKETADKKEAVKQIFPLIFPKKQLLLTPRGLVLQGENNENINIDETNFEAFQNVLNQVFCINTGPMETQLFNPSNEKAKEIAEKLMRARQRVAAQKVDGEGSIFAQYLSTLTIGVNSMSLEDCKNLTMYQLFDLLERYMLYVNWDLDVRSRLAGGKPDKPAENWMKNIH